MINNKECFFCRKEIKSFEGVFMLGLDRPYINLWFHKECLNNIDDLAVYINEEIERIYEKL